MAKEIMFGSTGINEVNISGQGKHRAKRAIDNIASRGSAEVKMWDGVGKVMEAAGKIADSYNEKQAAQLSLIEAYDGKQKAYKDMQESSGLSANVRLDVYKNKIREMTTAFGNDEVSESWTKGYIGVLEGQMSKAINESAKETTDSAAQVIRANIPTYLEEIYNGNVDTLVDTLHQTFDYVPRSAIRDSIYGGVSDSLVGQYSLAVTQEDLDNADTDAKKLKSKFQTNNYRTSNSAHTKAMVTNADSAIKTARDTAILRIQQPFKEEKSVLNTSVDSTSNIDLDFESGQLTILPTNHVSDKEYSETSIAGGYSKESTITDTSNYSIKRDKNIRIRNEVKQYMDFMEPFKDKPIDAISKKILDESYQLQVLSALRIYDTGLAASLVSNVQQKVPVGIKVKSLIYSDDIEMQKNGLIYYNKIANAPEANKLMPMLFEPKEISEFTAISSLTKAGYTVEQTVQSIENYKATPEADRRKPTKDVNEKLNSVGEHMTSKQYTLAKEMTQVMSNSGVAESVIEDYLESFEDKMVTKVGTTLKLGGITVLNEGGSVPNVTEDILVSAYEKLFEKVLQKNQGLDKDDLSVVILKNSNNAVVVLKQDTSVVLSQGTTNLNDLTKALVIQKARTPKQTNVSATGEEIPTMSNRLQQVGNFLVDDVPAALGNAKDTVIDALTPEEFKDK